MTDVVIVICAIVITLICPIILYIGAKLQLRKEEREFKKKEKFIAEIEARENQRKYYNRIP